LRKYTTDSVTSKSTVVCGHPPTDWKLIVLAVVGVVAVVVVVSGDVEAVVSDVIVVGVDELQEKSVSEVVV